MAWATPDTTVLLDVLDALWAQLRKAVIEGEALTVFESAGVQLPPTTPPCAVCLKVADSADPVLTHLDTTVTVSVLLYAHGDQRAAIHAADEVRKTLQRDRSLNGRATEVELVSGEYVDDPENVCGVAILTIRIQYVGGRV